VISTFGKNGGLPDKLANRLRLGEADSMADEWKRATSPIENAAQRLGPRFAIGPDPATCVASDVAGMEKVAVNRTHAVVLDVKMNVEDGDRNVGSSGYSQTDLGPVFSEYASYRATLAAIVANGGGGGVVGVDAKTLDDVAGIEFPNYRRCYKFWVGVVKCFVVPVMITGPFLELALFFVTVALSKQCEYGLQWWLLADALVHLVWWVRFCGRAIGEMCDGRFCTAFTMLMWLASAGYGSLVFSLPMDSHRRECEDWVYAPVFASVVLHWIYVTLRLGFWCSFAVDFSSKAELAEYTQRWQYKPAQSASRNTAAAKFYAAVNPAPPPPPPAPPRPRQPASTATTGFPHTVQSPQEPRDAASTAPPIDVVTAVPVPAFRTRGLSDAARSVGVWDPAMRLMDELRTWVVTDVASIIVSYVAESPLWVIGSAGNRIELFQYNPFDGRLRNVPVQLAPPSRFNPVVRLLPRARVILVVGGIGSALPKAQRCDPNSNPAEGPIEPAAPNFAGPDARKVRLEGSSAPGGERPRLHVVRRVDAFRVSTGQWERWPPMHSLDPVFGQRSGGLGLRLGSGNDRHDDAMDAQDRVGQPVVDALVLHSLSHCSRDEGLLVIGPENRWIPPSGVAMASGRPAQVLFAATRRWVDLTPVPACWFEESTLFTHPKRPRTLFSVGGKHGRLEKRKRVVASLMCVDLTVPSTPSENESEAHPQPDASTEDLSRKMTTQFLTTWFHDTLGHLDWKNGEPIVPPEPLTGEPMVPPESQTESNERQTGSQVLSDVHVAASANSRSLRTVELGPPNAKSDKHSDPTKYVAGSTEVGPPAVYASATLMTSENNNTESNIPTSSVSRITAQPEADNKAINVASSATSSVFTRTTDKAESERMAANVESAATGSDTTVNVAGVITAPSANTWRALTPMRYPRSAPFVCCLDGRVVVVGGEVRDDCKSSAVEVYDIDTDTWAELPPLPCLFRTWDDERENAAAMLTSSSLPPDPILPNHSAPRLVAHYGSLMHYPPFGFTLLHAPISGAPQSAPTWTQTHIPSQHTYKTLLHSAVLSFDPV
jgi:hypothetical protein